MLRRHPTTVRVLALAAGLVAAMFCPAMVAKIGEGASSPLPLGMLGF
jgi:hypothetical protein